MKPQSFIITTLIAVLVLAILAWYAHSIRMKRRGPAELTREMRAELLFFANPDNPIRDRQTLRRAARARISHGMIGYAPFTFHDTPVALMLVFPEASPTQPSEAQLTAYEILLERYTGKLADRIFFAAHDHALAQLEEDPAQEGKGLAQDGDPVEIFSGNAYTPVQLFLLPAEKDGVAFATLRLHVGSPPYRYDVRLHGGNIVAVDSHAATQETEPGQADLAPVNEWEGR